MAELVSDSDARAVKPPPKRRRILDASAIVPVPVYSSKVNSLQLTSATPTFSEKENTGDGLWSEFSCAGRSATVFTLSDSEEEEAEHGENKAFKPQTEVVHCPSPPPPESPVQTQSRQVIKTISDIDRRLQVLNSLLSPETRDRTETRTRSKRNRRRVSPPPTSKEEEEEEKKDDDDDDDDDDDVIIMNPESSPYSSSVREIPLKIRCRTFVHKIAVLSSTPLWDVLSQLSSVLHVPTSRLLLLKEEVELATDATVGEIGLGIADIVECVVMAAEDKHTGDGGGANANAITVKLQSKDRDSSQEFSLDRDAPLASVFSQYLSRVPRGARRTVAFYFDGAKVTDSQTPAELDMEDGDIVEVWT